MTGGEREGAGGVDRPPGDVSCEEALSRVYEYLDGELDPESQERIHRHIEICRRCYPFFDFERLFLDYIEEKGLTSERRERLQERVLRVLEEAS